jgi:hypothetical protein
MFQLGFAEVIQADREREIAELVRQRRLLQPHADGQSPAESQQRGQKQARRVRTQAAGG